MILGNVERLAKLMLDLDHFKEVNDRHGHQVGDMALKKLVQICQGILREVDVIGRLGGEEFAIMLPETREGSKAFEIAERLRQVIAATEVPLSEGSPLHITTSIGATSLLEDDISIEMILKRADKALYEAKAAGRNRVRI